MRAALWMCTLVGLPAMVRAQAPTSHDLQRGERSYGLWAGASLASSTAFGTITDRQLILTGLRLEYVLDGGGAATTYTFDLHPLAVVTNTPRYGLEQVRARNGRMTTRLVETGRAAAVGVGVSPVGLQLYSSPRRGARFFASGSAGGIWFNREMPVWGAHRFNFALQAGAGVELAAGGGGGFVVGYKFHHLSNAGTAAANPGVDGHVFYLGLMRRRMAGRVVASGGEDAAAGAEERP